MLSPGGPKVAAAKPRLKRSGKKKTLRATEPNQETTCTAIASSYRARFETLIGCMRLLVKAAAVAVTVIPTAFGLLRKRKLLRAKAEKSECWAATRIHVNVS